MLKVRVIPLLLIQDGLLKKPVRFRQPRTVAFPVSIARVFDARDVDELIMLDIGCTTYAENINTEIVRDIADELFVPFACGGGIRSVEHMLAILNAGAEKVVINTAAAGNPGLIREGAERFGSQCIVVSIDAKKNAGGTYEVFTHNGTVATGREASAWAKEAERLGAGEILINSIDHDGVMKGYNLELIRKVADTVKIPVIAAGGAGKIQDCVEAVREGHASAVAAASLYHYTRVTPKMVKEAMREAGIPVRLPAGEILSYKI